MDEVYRVNERRHRERNRRRRVQNKQRCQAGAWAEPAATFLRWWIWSPHGGKAGSGGGDDGERGSGEFWGESRAENIFDGVKRKMFKCFLSFFFLVSFYVTLIYIYFFILNNIYDNKNFSIKFKKKKKKTDVEERESLQLERE